MERFKFYLLTAFIVFVFQACSVDSNNHIQASRSGWYQDPMNPKYAMKKNNEHKPSSTDGKHTNIIRE